MRFSERGGEDSCDIVQARPRDLINRVYSPDGVSTRYLPFVPAFVTYISPQKPGCEMNYVAAREYSRFEKDLTRLWMSGWCIVIFTAALAAYKVFQK